MTRNTKLAIAGSILFFVLFYLGVSLASGDHEVIGLPWQMLIIGGAAGAFTFLMLRNLRKR